MLSVLSGLDVYNRDLTKIPILTNVLSRSHSEKCSGELTEFTQERGKGRKKVRTCRTRSYLLAKIRRKNSRSNGETGWS